MSIRTVIEINHDRLHNWQESPEFAAQIIYKALCGVERGLDGALETLGVRVLIQRHHSTKCTIEIE